MYKFFIFTIILLSHFQQLRAQALTPIGTWRYHLPYNSAHTLDIYNNKIYCASSASAFTYDLTSGELAPLSKLNGLNDRGISVIRTNESTNTLLIGYENGNIDLIKEDEIININDIHRKNMVGSKKINHIFCKDHFAYIATDFGLVVLDLKKLEIKETYSNLGPSGTSSKIYGSVITDDKDSIFLATEHGILAARFAPNVNLMDFSMWYRFGTADSISTKDVKAVSTLNGIVYAGVNDDGIYYFNGSHWKRLINLKSIGTFYSLRHSNNKLIASATYRVITISDPTNYEINYPTSNPMEAVLDKNNNIFIADATLGLAMWNNWTTLLALNGPYTINNYRLFYLNNSIYSVPGSFNSYYGHTYREGGFTCFKNGEWKNYRSSHNTFPYSFDIVSASFNFKNKKTYFGTVGFGFIELDTDSVYKFYTDTNTVLSRQPEGAWETYVSDIVVDSKGIMWIANPSSGSLLDPTLHWVSTDSIAYPTAWKSKSFGLEDARYPLEIIIDDANNKWIRLGPGKGKGLIVFNETKPTNSWKHLTTEPGNGNLPDPSVQCIVKDKKGEIWVGTNKGVAVFYDPSAVLNGSNFDANTPIVNQYPLLFDQQITCIEVDGGNRKWIGTREGLWLFSEDGTEVIYNFTSSNSMLPSNYIMDLEIDEATGEVFIATDKGLVSFRGTSTESNKKYSNVKVFPNPVKPDFNGLVGISGLAANVNVKITDIYGNLVYETKANGGTATWNVRDYNGRRAKTGVYLVYTGSEEGDLSLVSKIAVVE